MIYSEGFLHWVNLDYEGNPRQADSHGQIETGDSMIAMALSSNKLIILYDGSIEYFQITTMLSTMGKISRIFNKDFTDDIDEPGVYRFTISCICRSLKRFSCYSSTLNCLLIKKAEEACGGRDLPPPPGDEPEDPLSRWAWGPPSRYSMSDSIAAWFKNPLI